MRRTIAVLTAVATLAACGVLFAVSAAPAEATHCTASTSPAGSATPPNPLRGLCTYLDGRRGVVQVTLFNKQTGWLYSLSTGSDKQYTASIAKVDILAQWLHRYQTQGVEIPAGIPYSIRDLMEKMIKHSDNSAATELFSRGGGCEGLTQFNKLIPMDQTKVGCATPTYYGWGNTTTTAADQVKLMRLYAYGEKSNVLGSQAASYGLRLMQSVEPRQRFGISCGPWGTKCDPPYYAPPNPEVTVALKNGWKTLPTCTQSIQWCPWQVNSTGRVKGQGRDYVLTVLTTRDPVGTGGSYGFNYGVNTIQGISKRIWANLSSG